MDRIVHKPTFFSPIKQHCLSNYVMCITTSYGVDGGIGIRVRKGEGLRGGGGGGGVQLGERGGV